MTVQTAATTPGRGFARLRDRGRAQKIATEIPESDRSDKPGIWSPALGQSGSAQSSAQAMPSETQARGLAKMKIRFVNHPSFSDANCINEILGPMPAARRARPALTSRDAQAVPQAPRPAPFSREQEVYYFRKLNFLKYLAAERLSRIDAASPSATDLEHIESCRDQARAIRNQIVRSNLGLVVSFVKKWNVSAEDFFDLVAEGNIALLRATERFDFARGIRFSTYASWAIRRELGRCIPKERLRRCRFATASGTMLQNLSDHRHGESPDTSRVEQTRDCVRKLLSRLDAREQAIIARRFELSDGKPTLMQLGRELGISKERVRQLETRALNKLREFATSLRLDPNCY